MAAALHPPRNDSGPSVHLNLYPRGLLTELDNRYPTLSLQSKGSQRSSGMLLGDSDRLAWENTSSSPNAGSPRSNMDPGEAYNTLKLGWAAEQQGQPEQRFLQPQRKAGASADVQSLQSLSNQSQSQEPARSTLSYALPSNTARRVVERYSLDENPQRTPSRASVESRPTAVDSTQDIVRSKSGTQLARQNTSQERPLSTLPSTPRHPSLPAAGMGIGAGPSNPISANFSPPLMPLSASPAYNPPVSPNHRAFAQQPTYVTPQNAPNPVNTIYSPRPVPQEEVCVECAMRDQDMADVDVTSPGVWERESDVMFEDLKRREREDEATGIMNSDDPTRPKSKGGRLTEQNLKMWLSVNPKEPASRQMTLHTYIKSQRTLLEAEALAHARAMQEAKQLDNRMRDAYSQLRRSAYDVGGTATATDDTGGVRIKPPQSPSLAAHPRSHSREITLLENGMIVEHVDVRKEEREARERKRKEEKRARKSSRGSVMDVTSIISAQSYAPQTDSGVGLKPYSRYSQASSVRPTSVLNAPLDRPDLPRAYSQASFSDVHSIGGSASPRRSRFFGIKNLSAGWRSQDSLAPSGMSGSMVDMHVALQREAYGQQKLQSPVDFNTSRRSQIWPLTDSDQLTPQETPVEEKPKKKKKGFAKIWHIVTGSSKNNAVSSREPSRSFDRTEDDLPLAPPPPLSYLVNRTPGEHPAANGRHASTPSLPSATSPKSAGMSPPTAPSSILPSPVSSRPSGADVDIEVRHNSGNHDDQEPLQQSDDTMGKGLLATAKIVHPVTSEPDMRQRLTQNVTLPPMPIFGNFATPSSKPSSGVTREKSLPPLPGETRNRTLTNAADSRPRTVYTYDPRQPMPGSTSANDFQPPKAPFRNDVRRQSFGGLSTRPGLSVQTMPLTSKQSGYGLRNPLTPNYDEFGNSRMSLGRLEHVQENSPTANSPMLSTKRKSRFGLSSLLGKKSMPNDAWREDAGHQFPSMRGGSDGQDEMTTNGGYATSTSRHSALSAGGQITRMSVTSRKALEDLVAQDPNFVAYRYPSNDQRLDLLR